MMMMGILHLQSCHSSLWLQLLPLLLLWTTQPCEGFVQPVVVQPTSLSTSSSFRFEQQQMLPKNFVVKKDRSSSSRLFVHMVEQTLTPILNETDGGGSSILFSSSPQMYLDDPNIEAAAKTPPTIQRNRLVNGRNNKLPARRLPSHEHDQPHSKEPVSRPRVIFGTAALGKAENPFALLDAAYELGFRRFDLARTYGGDGVSERLFGAWMKQRQQHADFNLRASVEIITKGGMGADKYGNPNRPLLTRDALRAEIDASLQALQTDYVDMYMFHRDDVRIPVEQFVHWAHDELIVTGQSKQWGVSNWSFERFRAAFEYSLQAGLEPPRANSPQFSLAIPRGEVWPTTQSISGPEYVEQIAWYEQNQVELLCWEVLAKGFMAKPNLWNEDAVDPAFLHDTTVEIGTDAWRLQRIQKAYCYEGNYHRRRLAVQLAHQYNCPLSQIVTLYILSRGPHISVIFGSNNLEHLPDMVACLLFPQVQQQQLDPKDLQLLDDSCHNLMLPSSSSSSTTTSTETAATTTTAAAASLSSLPSSSSSSSRRLHV